MRSSNLPSLRRRHTIGHTITRIEMKKVKTQKRKSDWRKSKTPESDFTEKNAILSKESSQSASSSGSKKHKVKILASARNTSTKKLTELLSNNDSLFSMHIPSNKGAITRRMKQESLDNFSKPSHDALQQFTGNLNRCLKKTATVKRLRERREVNRSPKDESKDEEDKANISENNQAIALRGVSVQRSSLSDKSSSAHKMSPPSGKAKISKTGILIPRSLSMKRETQIPQRIGIKTRKAKSESPLRVNRVSRIGNVEKISGESSCESVRGGRNRSTTRDSLLSNHREVNAERPEHISRISLRQNNIKDRQKDSSLTPPLHTNNKKRVLSPSNTRSPEFTGNKKRKTYSPSSQQKEKISSKAIKTNNSADTLLRSSRSPLKHKQNELKNIKVYTSQEPTSSNKTYNNRIPVKTVKKEKSATKRKSNVETETEVLVYQTADVRKLSNKKNDSICVSEQKSNLSNCAVNLDKISHVDILPITLVKNNSTSKSISSALEYQDDNKSYRERRSSRKKFSKLHLKNAKTSESSHDPTNLPSRKMQIRTTHAKHNRSMRKGNEVFESSSIDNQEKKLSDKSDILNLISDLQTISTQLKSASEKSNKLKPFSENSENCKSSTKERFHKSGFMKSKNKHFHQSTVHRGDQIIQNVKGSESQIATTSKVSKDRELKMKNVTPSTSPSASRSTRANEKRGTIQNRNEETKIERNDTRSRKHTVSPKPMQFTKSSPDLKNEKVNPKVYLGKKKMLNKNSSRSKKIGANPTHRRSLRRNSIVIYNRTGHQTSTTVDNIIPDDESEKKLFNSKKSRSRRDFVRQKTANKYISVHKVKLKRQAGSKKSSKPQALQELSLTTRLSDRLVANKVVTEASKRSSQSKPGNAEASPKSVSKVPLFTLETSSVKRSESKSFASSNRSNKKYSSAKNSVRDVIAASPVTRETRCTSALPPSKTKSLPRVRKISSNINTASDVSPASSTSRLRSSLKTEVKKTLAMSLSLSQKRASRRVSSATYSKNAFAKASHSSSNKILPPTTSVSSPQSKTILSSVVSTSSSENQIASSSSTNRRSLKSSAPSTNLKLAPEVKELRPSCRKTLFTSWKKKQSGRRQMKRSTRSTNTSISAESLDNVISPSLKKTFKHKYVQVSLIPSMLNIQKLVSKLPSGINILTHVRDELNKTSGEMCSFTEIISIDDLLSYSCSSNYIPECETHLKKYNCSTESEKLHELQLKSGKIVNMIDKKVYYSPSRSRRHNRGLNGDRSRLCGLSPVMISKSNVASHGVVSMGTKTNDPIKVNDDVFEEDNQHNEMSNNDDKCEEHEELVDNSDNEIVFNLKKASSLVVPDQAIKDKTYSEVSSLKEISLEIPDQILTNKQRFPFASVSTRTTREIMSDSMGDNHLPKQEHKEKTNRESHQYMMTDRTDLFPNSGTRNTSQNQASMSIIEKAQSAGNKSKLATSIKPPKSQKIKPMSKPKKKKRVQRRKKQNPVIKVHRVKKHELSFVFNSSIDRSESDTEDELEDEEEEINNEDNEPSDEFNGIDTLDVVDEHDIFLLSQDEDDVKDKSPSKSKNNSTERLGTIKGQYILPTKTTTNADDLKITSPSYADVQNHSSTNEKDDRNLSADTEHLELPENAIDILPKKLRHFRRALELNPVFKKDNSVNTRSLRTSSAMTPKADSLKSKSDLQKTEELDIHDVISSQRQMGPRDNNMHSFSAKISTRAAFKAESRKSFTVSSERLDARNKESTSWSLEQPGRLKSPVNLRVTRYRTSIAGQASQSRDSTLKKSKSLTEINLLNSSQCEMYLSPLRSYSLANLNKGGAESFHNGQHTQSKKPMSDKINVPKDGFAFPTTRTKRLSSLNITTPKISIKRSSLKVYPGSSSRKERDKPNCQKMKQMTSSESARSTRSNTHLTMASFTETLLRGSPRSTSVSKTNRPTIKVPSQVTKSSKMGLKTTAVHKKTNSNLENWDEDVQNKKQLIGTESITKSISEKYCLNISQNSEALARTVKILRSAKNIDKNDSHLRQSETNTADIDVTIDVDLDDSKVTRPEDLRLTPASKHKVRNKRKRMSLVLSQQNYVNIKGYKKGRYLLRLRRKRNSAGSPKSEENISNFQNMAETQLRLHRVRRSAPDFENKNTSFLIKGKSPTMIYSKSAGKVKYVKDSISRLKNVTMSNTPSLKMKENTKNENRSTLKKSKRNLQTPIGKDTQLKSVSHSTPSSTFRRASEMNYSTRSFTCETGGIHLQTLQNSVEIRSKKKQVKEDSSRSSINSQNSVPVFVITEPTPVRRRDIGNFRRWNKTRGHGIFSQGPSSTSSDNEDREIQSYFSSATGTDSLSFSYGREDSTDWSEIGTPSSEYGRRMLRVLDRRQVLASPLKKRVEYSVFSNTIVPSDISISDYTKFDFEDLDDDYEDTSLEKIDFANTSLEKDDFTDMALEKGDGSEDEGQAALKNVRFKLNPSDSCTIL